MRGVARSRARDRGERHGSLVRRGALEVDEQQDARALAEPHELVSEALLVKVGVPAQHPFGVGRLEEAGALLVHLDKVGGEELRWLSASCPQDLHLLIVPRVDDLVERRQQQRPAGATHELWWSGAPLVKPGEIGLVGLARAHAAEPPHGLLVGLAIHSAEQHCHEAGVPPPLGLEGEAAAQHMQFELAILAAWHAAAGALPLPFVALPRHVEGGVVAAQVGRHELAPEHLLDLSDYGRQLVEVAADHLRQAQSAAHR